ncbi:NAD(P)-dependent oxidoreductase [Roseibacterium sp. SDUM158017]|uniref:L-threonate dehydrogenase n=1 Tax=Roseicyclus salinarum TaxID=3036773 RepID=UPI002415527F|nr:L-threonate dehydrogenase [Roseibacterium sp. SDUM158017]MDG4649753.1 NAD(P)-dependent oxidoreductase [Roseibacterium sp. SDUM158017]
MKRTSVLVIGLGSMGFGMAQSCLRAGLATRGVDVNPEAEARFAASGGQAGDALAAAADLDAVAVVVLNAVQLEAVLFGPEGIVPHLRAGAVVIACPTVAPSVVRDMAARCAGRGVHYLDAPISGGAVKAAEGALSIMASGPAEAFEAAGPVLEATAAKVFRLGDVPGAGSAMKAVNQLLAGVHIAAMGEAMAFGMTQGVRPDTFLEVISQCAGTSWMLENRAPHVIEGDYTPRSQIAIWPKDLGIVLDIAREAKFAAPITAAALQQYMVAVGMGLASEDDAAITKVYARNAGLKLPGAGGGTDD